MYEYTVNRKKRHTWSAIDKNKQNRNHELQMSYVINKKTRITGSLQVKENIHYTEMIKIN